MSRRRPLAAWLAPVLLCLGAAAPARADGVSVVAATPADPHLEALSSALSREGITAEAVRDACPRVDCLGEVARRRGTRHALRYAIESGGAMGDQLHVWLSDPRGALADARVPLEGRSPAEVIAAAYRGARQRLRLGDRAVLAVETVPEGAAIELDGQAAGHAPVEVHVEAGAHSLVAAVSGFEPAERRLVLAEGQVHTVRFELTRRPMPVSPPVESPPSTLNAIVGGTLVAASLVALWVAGDALLSGGECDQRDADGDCQRRARFDAGDAVLLGAGVLALGGGTYLLVARPIRVDSGPVAMLGWAGEL